MESSAVSARLIGALFIEKGLITEEQLARALEEQRSSGERLGEILVERFGISRLDLASALAEQWAEYERPAAEEAPARPADGDPAAVLQEWASGTAEPARSDAASGTAADEDERRPIGEIFVERGFLSAEELEQALVEQRETGQRLGEILVAKGVVSRLELASALADQWSNLQKLRPPSTEPERGPAPPQAAPPAGAVSDVNDIRVQLANLTSRVEVSERRLGDEPAPEVRAQLDELAARMETIADQPAGPDALAPLSDRLAELAGRVESLSASPGVDDTVAPLAERVEQVAGRLDELAAAPDPETAVAPLVNRVEQLARRLEEVAASRPADDALTSIRDGLEAASAGVFELRARLDARDDESHGAFESRLATLSSAVEALAHRIDGLADGSATEAVERRLDALEQRPVAAPEDTNVRDAVVELNARVARLASLPTADEVVASVRAQVASLTAKVSELAEAAEADPDDALEPFAAELSTLARRVDELAAAQAAAPSPGEALAPLRAELAALQARLDDAPGKAELRQAVDGLDTVRDTIARLAERVQGLESEAPPSIDAVVEPLRAALAAIEDRLHERDWVDAVAALESRTSALETRPQEPPALEELRAAVVDLDAKLARLAESPEVQQVRDRLDAVESRLARAADADRVDAAEAALAARLVQVEELARRAGAREEELDGLAATTAELRARVDELNERGRQADALEHAQGRLDERLGYVESKLDDVAAVESRVQASLAPLVHDATSGLVEEQRALQGRLDGADRLAGELDSVRARIDGLDSRLAGQADLERRLHDTLAPLDEAAAAIREEQDALRQRLGEALQRLASVDSVAGRLSELETRLGDADRLEERLRAELGSAVRAAVDPLAQRVGQLGARVDEAAASTGRLDEVSARLDSIAGVEERLHELTEAQDARHGEHRRGLDELRRRLSDVLAPFEHGLDDLRARLDATAQADATDTALAALAGRLDAAEERAAEAAAGAGEAAGRLDGELAELRRRVEDLSRAHDDLGARHERALGEAAARQASAVDTVRAQMLASMDALGSRLEGAATVDDLRQALEALGGRLDDLAGETTSGAAALREELAQARSALSAEARALEQRLQEQADETAGVERTAREHVVGELREETSSLSTRLERVESGDAVAALAAELRAAVDQLHGRVDGSRDELAAALQRSDEALAAVRERQDEHERAVARDRALAQSARAEAAGVGDRLAALEHAAGDERAALEGRFEELGNRLDDSQRHVAEAHAALGAALESVDGRIEDGRRRVDQELEAVRAELETLENTAVERDAAAVDERAQAREQVERAVASLGWRIERVEEALAGDDRDEVRHGVAVLADRLDALAQQSDERVRLTEKAVRKGLATLGARLAESEDAYVEAGNALRRSIDRLGQAVAAADDHVGAGTSGTETVDSNGSGSFLAFAPTGEGYRLVEIDGRTPEVGDELSLPGATDALLATRISRSPLPFDRRACVYLERRTPVPGAG